MTNDEIAAARSLAERLANRIGMEPHFAEAADTIERLCDEVERLQRKIIRDSSDDWISRSKSHDTAE